MRILIISNLFPPDVIGGYELGCFRIARALADQGHSIVIATSEPRDGGTPLELDARLKVRRIFRPVWDFDERALLRGNFAFRTAQLLRIAVADIPSAVALRRLLDQEAFDVCYLFNPVGLGPLSLMETLLTTSVPRVFHIMDNFDQVMHHHLRSAGLLSRYADLKKHFSAHACSRGCLERNSLVGQYGHSEVIFSGVEESAPASTPEVKSSPRAFRFACHGQIAPHKGTPELLQAFQKVRASARAPVELHFIGKIQEDYRNEFHRLAGQDIRAGRIVLHGPQSHPGALALLRNMDLGVYPLSATEPYGYAACECLASGLAAVITRSTGCCEMLSPSYPLLVSRREEIDEMAGAMVRGMEEATLRTQALACFEQCRRMYDFDRYTLPAIQHALLTAPREPVHASFADTVQRYRAVTDLATFRPQSIFHGFS